MNTLRLATYAAAALVVACSGDGASQTAPGGETQVSGATAPIAELDPDEPRLSDLIYWESFFTELGDPGSRREALLEEIGARAQDDAAYRAVLIELALYPTPYRERAWELLDTGEAFSTEAVLALFGELGPASSEDDSDAYVEFKSICSARSTRRSGSSWTRGPNARYRRRR